MTQMSRPGHEAPCDWPVSYVSCSGGEDAIPTPEEKALFEGMASTYLWEWTDRRYGLCPVTVRPCRKKCSEAFTSTYWSGVHPTGVGYGAMFGIGGWMPVLISGVFYNIQCGGCGSDECSCGEVSRIRLPGPVASISSISIDGDVLNPAAYRLDGSLVIREDGGEWPSCQHLEHPLGQDGTWGVTYQHGVPVPPGGQVAAGILAVELYKAACNDGSCQLPRRVQSITRQGVTMAMLDTFEGSVEKGWTGIWLIDSWLASVTRPIKPSVVISPDYRNIRR